MVSTWSHLTSEDIEWNIPLRREALSETMIENQGVIEENIEK